ncbi:MAG: DUF4825 domain-containing protein [Lachnospiraceae bacterium]
MKIRIPCTMIKDIMPTYLDELTSQETNEMIEEHLKECEECSHLFADMREPKTDETEKNKETAEIDFLKKNRKRSKRILKISMLIAVIGLFIGLMAPLFVKHELSCEEVDLNLTVGDVTIDTEYVEDGLLSLTAKAYGSYGISRIDFEEENETVIIKVIGARDRIFTEPVYMAMYNPAHTIKEVRLGNSILWKDGITISQDTLRSYKTAHPYVGDHVKNGETLSALKVSDTLGGYAMELHTKEEPYGMTITLQKPVEEEKESYLNRYMGFAACNCMALIDNLSYVNFQYEVAGEPREIEWNLERANQQLGKPVKEYGESEISLESLKWDYWK